MAEPEGWIRLHPLSPVLSAGRLVLGALLVTVQAWADEVFVSAGGSEWILRIGGLLLLGGLVALTYAAVAWRFYLYRLTPDRIELKTGILFRSSRSLPYERIESVDTAQPFIPRVFGLAEVRVEAISKQGSELRLRYLTLADADRLRLELIGRRRSGTSQQPALDTETTPIVRVPANELVKGYLTIPALAAAAVSIPVLVVVGIVGGAAQAGVVVLVGLLSALGFVIPALLRVEHLWDFRIDDAGDALVIHRGLLNLNTQRIVTGRVQALRIDQPLLWRPYKRFRVVVDVAGYRGAKNDAAALSANVLPIAPYEAVRYLLYRLEARVDLSALPFEPVPHRARWRSLRSRSFRAVWTDTHAVVQSGVLWRRTSVVPHGRLQSARVTQGPWQRRLRLATVRLDTAGSHVKAAALHRDEREAVVLANQSATRSREDALVANSTQ